MVGLAPRAAVDPLAAVVRRAAVGGTLFITALHPLDPLAAVVRQAAVVAAMWFIAAADPQAAVDRRGNQAASSSG
jgi:hypothetical protein